MSNFLQTNPNPKGKNIGDCVIRAIALATNQEWAKVYLDLCLQGYLMNDMQNMNALQAQLAQFCCDNRLATCQTQNIVQNEGASTRLAIQNQTQAILDKLCQLELDGYKRENDNLRSQLNMATLRESQTAQNAFIAQGLNNEVDQLYNRLNNCPVPTTPVYGRTPIFSCNNQNQGCGCGMA